MARFIGMDVQKREVEICMVDQKGTVLKRSRCACDRETLKKLARKQFTKRDHVALETTTNDWAVADLIRPHVARVAGFNTGLITDGKWHNYAVLFDQVANQIEIFIDEQSKGTVDLTTLAGRL